MRLRPCDDAALLECRERFGGAPEATAIATAQGATMAALHLVAAIARGDLHLTRRHGAALPPPADIAATLLAEDPEP